MTLDELAAIVMPKLPLVSVKLMTRTPELLEDMGEWENVNCYGSGTFTLNRWIESGFKVRLVQVEKDQVLVIRAAQP